MILDSLIWKGGKKGQGKELISLLIISNKINFWTQKLQQTQFFKIYLQAETFNMTSTISNESQDEGLYYPWYQNDST